jgi:hypothetical protein
MTGPTANLALWLNTQSLTFAEGPNSEAPFFAPLTITQNGTYIVDVYYVVPTYNAGVPWTYLDPTTFTGASITIGNRQTFAAYVTLTGYTILTDGYGTKLRFIFVLNSTQLNTDLTAQASVPAVFQANWSTSSSAPVAQLSSQINKEMGVSGGGAPSYSGTVALGIGINDYVVTGLALPSVPATFSVQVLKQNANDDNVTATLRQGFTTDGFTVDFNENLPNANYILSWQAIYANP